MENTDTQEEVIDNSLDVQETEVSFDDLKKQLEAEKLQKEQIERALDQAKRSQSGSDKTVMELKKRLDSLEKEKMSDEEKVKYAEEQAEKVRLEYESKLRGIELEKFVSEKVADIQIESRFSSLVEGKDEVSITQKADLLIELLKQKEEFINESWRAKGGKPSGGVQVANMGDDLANLKPQQESQMYLEIKSEKGQVAADQFLKQVSAAKKNNKKGVNYG